MKGLVEVSELTKKLAKIWEVPVPKSWEEVGAIYGMSGEEAKKRGIDWDEAWAAKVRRDLPLEGLRYTRLKPHLKDLTPAEMASIMEFFGPMTKMMLMKDRADLQDKAAKETLELFLKGDPTADPESLAGMGFIEWWRRSGEDPLKNLMRIGYSEEEIQRIFKLKTEKAKTVEEQLSELEEMKRELEMKMERLRRKESQSTP